MNTIISSNDVKQKYIDLKQSKAPIYIHQVPKDLDEYILNQNQKKTQAFHIGLWAGITALTSAITEVRVARLKNISYDVSSVADKIKKMRKTHIEAPILFAIGLIFSYFEVKQKKLSGDITKEQIYKSQGINLL